MAGAIDERLRVLFCDSGPSLISRGTSSFHEVAIADTCLLFFIRWLNLCLSQSAVDHDLPFWTIVFFWMLRSVYRRILISFFSCWRCRFFIFCSRRGYTSVVDLFINRTDRKQDKHLQTSLKLEGKYSNWCNRDDFVGKRNRHSWIWGWAIAHPNYGFGWMNIPTADVASCWAVHGGKRGFEPQATRQKTSPSLSFTIPDGLGLQSAVATLRGWDRFVALPEVGWLDIRVEPIISMTLSARPWGGLHM